MKRLVDILKLALVVLFALAALPGSFAATLSYPLTLVAGWNLLGNSITTPLDVKATFGSQSAVKTVWKWNAVRNTWEFYEAAMDADGTLAAYAAQKGYLALSTINPGEGYWVDASAALTLANQTGTGFALAATNLVAGWNLVATGEPLTPETFSNTVGNATSLWAWDRTKSNWYFHAQSLVSDGTLGDYIATKAYRYFAGRDLRNGMGFWVNYAGGTPPALKGIAVLQSRPGTAYGATERLYAVGLYSDGTRKDLSSAVTWSSTDPSVAKVDASGLATMVKLGVTDIKATDPVTKVIGKASVTLATSGLNIESISAGGTEVMAVLPDGTLWGWGGNTYGQLGPALTPSGAGSATAVQVSGLDSVVKVSAGAYHAAAIKADGSLWTWGDNCCGQLGNGLSDGVFTFPLPPHPTASRVGGISGVTAVGAAFFHTAALRSDGTVWTWGYNAYGSLGNGTTTDSLVPVQVSGLSGVTDIAVGSAHTVALKSDGTVWTWGFNQYGQLGTGTTTNGPAPVQVSGLTGVRAVGSGANHSLAVKSDGTVWAWGFNYGGQLGNGTKTDSKVPVQVLGLSGVQAVTGGAGSSVALKSDGTAWVWGANTFGQLGDGTKVDQTTPIRYQNLTGVFAIAANFNQTIAVHHSEVAAVDCGDNADTKKKGCADVTAAEFLVAMNNSGLVGATWEFISPKDAFFHVGDSHKRIGFYTAKIISDSGTSLGYVEFGAGRFYESSDPSVITVDPSGTTFTAVGPGSAYIVLDLGGGEVHVFPVEVQ